MAIDPQDIEARNAAAARKQKAKNMEMIVPDLPIVQPASKEERDNPYINPIVDESGNVVYVDKSGRLPDGSTPIQARSGESFVQAPASVLPAFTASSTGGTESGPTLARETFKKTLGAIMGQAEAAKPWIDSLYNVVSGYYKTGLTIDDSLNLSLQDARNNPALKPFTDRFKGVFTLQDKLNKGMAVHVPTINEYVKTQEAIGNTLAQAGLSDLATQDFTGDLIGKNFSALDVGNILTKTFSAIQNADPFLKAHFASYGATDTQIAKALLTGDKTGAQLEQELKGAQMSAAAEMQGLKATDPFALARAGVSYGQAQTGFEQIAQNLQPAQNIAAIFGGQQGNVTPGNTQQQMEIAKFGTLTPGGTTSAQAQTNLKKLYGMEKDIFGGSAGADKGSLSGQSTAGAI